jgi:hypothetical protein
MQPSSVQSHHHSYVQSKQDISSQHGLDQQLQKWKDSCPSWLQHTKDTWINHARTSAPSSQRRNQRILATVLLAPAITNGKQTHFVYAAVLDIPIETGQIYTDQTGNFPNVLQWGNKYLMVLYDYDSNSILVEPLRNCTDAQMITAYDRLVEWLTWAGLKLRLQRLDNDASKALKKQIAQHEIKHQMVPLHVHHANAAERAIRTFKNHFIAGLCTIDTKFHWINGINYWNKVKCL